MSKGSQFWGNASGKLGQQVLYRAGGEQRARMHVAKIKNPKTLAQMENRLSMLNLVSTFRAAKDVIKVSFPNRKSNQSGFNAFVKANKNVNTAVISKGIADMGLSVPYNFVMSQGDINIFGAFEHVTLDDLHYFGFPVPVVSQNLNSVNHDMLSGMSNITSKVQLEQMLALLGLPTTTRITIIDATYQDDAFNVVVNQVSSETWNDVSSPTALGMTLVLGDLDWTGPAPFLSIAHEDDPEKMRCVIFSYTDGNGKLQVTTSRMNLLSDSAEYVEQFLKGGDVYEQVLEDYGYNQGSILATR